MKRGVFLFLFLVLPFHNSFPMFERVAGLEDTKIKRVIMSSLDENLIYVASDNTLFRSYDSAVSFEKVSVFKDEEIQHIFFDSYLADTLYLVTSRHLFKITDKTEKLFSSPDEAMILTAAKFNGQIYVGTTKGIYFASEDILNWRKMKGLREEVKVSSIEAVEKKIFFATGRGVYLQEEDYDGIKRVFVIRDTGDDSLVINVIKADVFDKSKIWLGTTEGLFVSEDKGLSWKKLYVEGINNLSINAITQTKLGSTGLYLASDKGVFRVDLKTKTSKRMFEGISGLEVSWIEFTSQGEIYLATPKGIFRNSYFTSFSQERELEEIINSEPSIEEIQQAALRYNEVHPEKMRKWHNALKYRGLLPTLSVNYDKTVDYDAGADKYYIGPYDWGVSVSWNIGDLVWNSYEDDVDVRNKLNVPVRLDILDEVNRVYFERLRLKQEISDSSLSEEEVAKKKLRIKELSASINGYTGGFFSKRTRELSGK
jgi:hypothetical protein